MPYLTSFWSLAVLLLGVIFAQSVAAADKPNGGNLSGTKPNVVFILADDLGFSDLGCYGGEIATPNLDRLAANGLKFTQFYNTARCWPSRAALLTGYYAQQVNRDPQGQRPKWAALLPQLMKPAGYRSYQTGKWHVDGPILAGGFERSYDIADQDRFFNPQRLTLDDQPIASPKLDEGYYVTTAVAQRGIQFLNEHQQQHRDEPFFLYLAFTSPHFPLHALPEDIARYRDRYRDGWDIVREQRWQRQRELGLHSANLSAPERDTFPKWNVDEAGLKTRIGAGEVGRAVPWTELSAEQQQFQATKMAIHAAMVDRMDREIGHVLDQLRAMQVFDNTLLFFASDNGASAEQIIRGDEHDPTAPLGSAKSYLGLGPGWSTAANTPFRKHKHWTHEGGIATPLVVHWPVGIKAHGELRRTPGHLIDIAPTLLELAGLTAPTTFNAEPRPSFPGRSLVATFTSDATPPGEPIFFKHQDNRALRYGDWKITAAGANSKWELYNLATDRSEMYDLAAQHPDKLQELVELWTARDSQYAQQGATGSPLPRAGKK